MTPVEINYVAVLGAAVASMMIGFLWYGPLFGKTWMALSGISQTSIDPSKKKGMNTLYALAFCGSIVMSFVLAHALVFASSYLQVSGISAGLMAGLWNWLGFIAPVTLGAVLWEGRTWKLWMFNNAYYIVTLCVMGVILSLFP